MKKEKKTILKPKRNDVVLVMYEDCGPLIGLVIDRESKRKYSEIYFYRYREFLQIRSTNDDQILFIVGNLDDEQDRNLFRVAKDLAYKQKNIRYQE